MIGVGGALCSRDKDIAEDWSLRNVVVIAEIIIHNYDCLQRIIALNLPPRPICLWNMALFFPVPQANAHDVVRHLTSWSKAEDWHAASILSRYWAE